MFRKLASQLREAAIRRLLPRLVLLLIFFGLLTYFEGHRGFHTTGSYFIVGVTVCVLITLLSELIEVGGWLIFFAFLITLYVSQTQAAGNSITQVFSTALASIRANGPTLGASAARLHDVYIVLASASFTLYGLFFIAVKRITLLNAARLVTISEGFGLVFIFCVPALMLSNAPWWRLGLMAGLSLSSLALFARELKPNLTDFGVDTPAVAAFWMDWMNQRRGFSMIVLFALSVLALWPVVGEVVLALSLSYILYGAARSASFLFISTEIQVDPLNYDRTLRSMFVIRVPAWLENQVNAAKGHAFGLWFMKSPAKRHVLFHFVNRPATRKSIPFSFRNQ